MAKKNSAQTQAHKRAVELFDNLDKQRKVWRDATPAKRNELVQAAQRDVAEALTARTGLIEPRMQTTGHDPDAIIQLVASALVNRGHGWIAATRACMRLLQFSVHPDAKPLSPLQQEVFDLICTEGPLRGNEITPRIGDGLTSNSTLTRHIIPALKRWGVQSSPSGYFYSPFQPLPDP